LSGKVNDVFLEKLPGNVLSRLAMKYFNRARGLQLDWSSMHQRPFRSRCSAGLSLFELSVAVFALLLLVTLFLTATKAWRRVSDRSMCINNIQAVQKGIRGFSSLSGLKPGEIVSGLQAQVVGAGKFFVEPPVCPAEGSYTLGGDQIPGVGTLYMTCNLAPTEGHVPATIVGW
jgi:hypothetical protein